MAKSRYMKAKKPTSSSQQPQEQSSQDTLAPTPEMLFDPLIFDTENFNHSKFLQKQGEMSLLHGDIKGLKYFDLATDLDQSNPELYFEQGLALFEYGAEHQKKKYLLLANKKFKLATKLKPNFFEAWHAWGNCLVTLGQSSRKQHFFLEAQEKFLAATKCTNGISQEQTFDFYWNFASLMSEIADFTQEVSDLQLSLANYAEAFKQEADVPGEFWMDYGNVCMLLAKQLNDPNLILRGIELLRQGVSFAPSSYKIWVALASSISLLYDYTHDEDHFCQASECFASAAKLNPSDVQIWLQWASLLKESGNRLKDTKRLHSAIEKCHRAFACDRKSEEATLIWTEILSSLGVLSDRLDLIYEGQNKALEAIDHFGPTPKLLRAHGSCLYALGKYYNDLDYYYQAIEKYQEGLSINRAEHHLWYCLGNAYAVTAEIENDAGIFERAARFFTKAIHLNTKSTYYYEYAVVLRKIAAFKGDLKTLELAILHFEQAFSLQKNAVYLHPDWLFQYALALDQKGDLTDEAWFYEKSIEMLGKVLMLDPDYPSIHFKLGIVYTHLGEFHLSSEPFYRAIHHFKIAQQNDEENEEMLLEWGITLMHLSELSSYDPDKQGYLDEAEYKLMQSAKLGNIHAYYNLACLFSIREDFHKSYYFLKKAEQYDGLPTVDDLLEDLWLESFRNTDIFRDFLSCIEKGQYPGFPAEE